MNRFERLVELSGKRTKGKWHITFERPDDFPCIYLDQEMKHDPTIDDLSFIDESANMMDDLIDVVRAAKAYADAVQWDGQPSKEEYAPLVKALSKLQQSTRDGADDVDG